MSQNIIVTGTNSGFGRLIVQTLVGKGHQVFATMRDVAGRNAAVAAELTAAGPGRVHVLEMSPGDDASVERAVAEVLAKAGHIDVLVNNAGFATAGLAETLTSQQLLEQYNINVVGPHRTMRAVLPSMRARGKGLIVQISSGLGRIVSPLMGTYCSSKFALEALSEAYRYELKPMGVEVTLLQPGAFPTELAQHMVAGAEQERAQGYGPLVNGLQMMGANFAAMFANNPPSPQLVADGVLALVEKPVGTRPARLVVDPISGQVVEALNGAIGELQKTALGVFQMGMLAD